MKIRSRIVASALASAVVTSLVLVGGHAASAQDTNPVFRSIDTRNFPAVQIGALLPNGSSVDGVKVQENGKPIDAKITSYKDSGQSVGVALLIDSTAATLADDTLEKEKAAAVKMVNGKPDNEKFAIVAYNSGARTIVNFTDNKQLLIDGINSMKASGDSALWDGLRTASSILQDNPDLQPNVVVMNASAESVSNATEEQALSSLKDSHALVFGVAVANAKANNAGSLKAIAGATDGRYWDSSDAGSLGGYLAGIDNAIGSQAYITYTSPSKDRALDITITSGAVSTTAHAAAETLALGSNTTPDAVEAKPLGIFGGIFGAIALGVVALLGVGLLVYAVVDLAGKERHQLSRALRPYNTDVEEERDLSKLADSAFMKKAVAETQRIAEERGFLVTVEKRLEQAEIPLKPAEAIFFTGLVAAIAMLLGAILGGILGFFAAGLIFGFLPVWVTSFKAKARKRKFTKQLPDTLQLMAGSLRAGYSLIQGLDAVAKQVEAPMGTELTRALSEARLGRPVEEALQEVSDRMQSDDFEWAVMAIKIQREVGGNLAELLITVSDTMIERERLRREVKALTAEGRISAIILVGLPPVIGALVSFVNPTYMTPMFHSFIGQVLLVGAALMMGIGYWLMNKLIQIEV